MAQEAVSIQSISPIEDENTPAGWFKLEGNVPPNALVTLQVNRDLVAGRWEDYQPPTLSGPNGTVHVMIDAPDAKVEQAYFRLRVEAAAIDVQDDGKRIHVKTTEPTPAARLFAALGAGKNVGFYGVEGVGPFTMLPPMDVVAPNLEDLFKSMGQRIWVTPTPEDDPTEASRLVSNSRLQPDPIPPGPNEIGHGSMDDGFEGVSSRPDPPSGPEIPPEIGPADGKKFNINLDPAGKGREQLEDPTRTEPGRHLRLALKLTLPDQIAAEFAVAAPGASPLPPAPAVVEKDALLYVVRDMRQGSAQSRPEFIGVARDPFERRSYGPDLERGHGDVRAKETRVRLTVPLSLDASGASTDVRDLSLTFYRAKTGLPENALLEAPLDQYLNKLTPIGQVTGQELDRLMALSSEGLISQKLTSGAVAEPTITKLHKSGSKAAKFNFAIIGEGFANTSSDQAQFNDYVDNVVMTDLFSNDVYPEILNSMNIYRINTFSKDSGVTQVDSNGDVTLARDTALDLRYSGLWEDCYFNNGPKTGERGDAIFNALLPEVDLIAVVVNETGHGGCGGSGLFIVTRIERWDVVAHEMGHATAGLGDEYGCNSNSQGCGNYHGAEPGAINLTTETDRAQIKWKEWIPATRPVPTHWTEVADLTQDVGLFAGATLNLTKYAGGIYRPSRSNRMGTGPSHLHSPVAYTRIREDARVYQKATFKRSVVGDFNGDGLTDLVLLDDRQLSLHVAAIRDVGDVDLITGHPLRPTTAVLEPTWYRTGKLRGPNGTTWSIRNGDQLIPADFNGDGLTDLFVVNLTDWSMPYFGMLRSTGTGFVPEARYDLELPAWDDMREHDEFYVGDFSGDGQDDLMVFNGRDWSVPYFLMLRSTGTSLVYSRRYSETLPGGLKMGDHEKFFVGDFNGDGREEVTSFNRTDWNQVHLMIFTSDGTELHRKDRHYGSIPLAPYPWPAWTMREKDQLFVMDFNGDGRSDLSFFNGIDWETEYMGIFGCTANAKIALIQRYEGLIPGWNMRRSDRYHVADVDGDGDDDLVVYNAADWPTQYLGILESDGANEFQGSWQSDWIGAWNLGANDEFHVADFRGAGGWDDLIVYNKGWLGLLRSKSNRFQLETIYRKWIHNHRYHESGWW